MRIGLDVRYLSHGLVGGIHTYLKNLIPALMAAAADHQLFLYADTKRPFDIPDIPPHVTLRLLPYRSPLSSFAHDFRMWRVMAQDKLDIAHFTGNYGFGRAGGRVLITLHDEINVLPWWEIIKGHPKNLRTVLMMSYLHYCSSRTVPRADAVLTVSEHAKRQIAHHAAIPLERIWPVPHGCPDDMWLEQDGAVLDEVRQRLGLTRPFILADARKNPDVILRAWRTLPEPWPQEREIIFFCRDAQVRPAVQEIVEAGYGRLFVRASRDDLRALFNLAEVFVFPSWIEGFGIPLVEAMTCGAPIIASDRGSIPEVAGEAGLIMDAEDDQTLRQYLLRLFEQPDERQRLRQLGLQRAPRYTWANAAKQHLEIYAQMI
ncbi:MAG: glycosyltransferase family 4 protein [Anaerolineae bacterium]|nr:glycosyltransferase family 4 protein [Anaerolineae bacterium]